MMQAAHARLRRPAAVFFDLDGTLVDSAPDLAVAVNTLMSAYDLPSHTLTAVRGMVGHGVAKLVERAFAAHGIALTNRNLIDKYLQMTEIYAQNLTRLTTVRPEAGDVVRDLRKAGIGTGVVTNKPEGFARVILNHFGLSPHLDIVIGGDSGYALKPEPEMLFAACSHCCCEPVDAVMVGDSGADVASSRAAGMRAVLLRGGYTETPADKLGADFVIDGFKDLPDLLVLMSGVR